MNCMKCGREIPEDQGFCPVCLEEMERYPVTPGTVVLLPEQMKYLPKKPTPRIRVMPSPEEQIATLRTKVRRLRLLLVLLLTLATAIGYMTYITFQELDIQRNLGQNYSTVIPDSGNKPPLSLPDS